MKSSITFLDLSHNPQLRELLTDATHRDGGHNAPLATHVFLRDNCEVVGAAGLAVPTLTFWASHSATRRESWEMTRVVNERMAALHPHYLCPCAPDSPFFPLMGKLGYCRLGPAIFFERR